MYARKFGAERVAAMFARLAPIGESEGIKFSFGGNTGSTRDSHRLIWLAGEVENKQQQQQQQQQQQAGAEIGGIQTRVVEKLFRAYFEEEKNITDRDVLREAGVGAGLDESAVKELLEGEADEGGEEVDAEAAAASGRLVSGVPFFEVQGKYAVEGADEPETFLEIFQRVKDEE
jgi:predicted DsbA family dithiol-disulfide isomerase